MYTKMIIVDRVLLAVGILVVSGVLFSTINTEYNSLGQENSLEERDIQYNLVSGDENWTERRNLPKLDAKEEIIEVSKYPDENYSDKLLESSWRLYSNTFDTAREKNWFNISKGELDGYNRVKGSHYPSKEYLYD